MYISLSLSIYIYIVYTYTHVHIYIYQVCEHIQQTFDHFRAPSSRSRRIAVRSESGLCGVAAFGLAVLSLSMLSAACFMLYGSVYIITYNTVDEYNVV